MRGLFGGVDAVRLRRRREAWRQLALAGLDYLALSSRVGEFYEHAGEGPTSGDTIDPEDVTLAAFALEPRKRRLFGRRR